MLTNRIPNFHRFVEVRTGAAKYNFNVPAGKCGTTLDEFSRTISNVLIFQMDEAVQVFNATLHFCMRHLSKKILPFHIQEIWDVAKKLTCKYDKASAAADSSKQGKMVIFKPLSVAMLNVQHEPISNGDKGTLDCWMDIQKGTYPNVRTFLFHAISHTHDD